MTALQATEKCWGGYGVPGKLFERGHPLHFDPATSFAVLLLTAPTFACDPLVDEEVWFQLGKLHKTHVQIAKGRFLD